MAELDLSYRGSPIVAGAGPLGWRGIQPGERVPEASAVDRHGGTVPLSDVLGGGRHTLLLFGDHADLGAAVRARWDRHVTVCFVLSTPNVPVSLADEPHLLLDVDGAVEARFEAHEDAVYLVRPDLYIGYRSRPASRAGLLDYLEGLLPGPS